MNPFDLSGPAFLGFYVVFVLAALAGALLVLRLRDRRDPAGAPTDPYAIAYLRGGPSEALRVVVLGLHDRVPAGTHSYDSSASSCGGGGDGGGGCGGCGSSS